MHRQGKNYLATILLSLFAGAALIGCGAADPAQDSTSSDLNMTYPVVDTDQTDCYDSGGSVTTCSGSGQDGAYSKNPMDYTPNQNGDIVTDNVTGLMWQQSGDINNDGAIDIDDKMTQSEAVSYCQDLTLGAYSDWRLPDIKTLYSLMDFNGQDPSGGSISADVPFINTDYFDFGYGDENAGERAIDSQWATTSIYVGKVMNNQTAMFGLNLADGRIKGYPTVSKTFYVKCVRDNTAYGQNNLSANGDGTVSDAATELMWQQEDSQIGMDWDAALTYCEDATTGGYSDWRLPSAKALHSIVDYARSPETTDSAALSPLFDATSFTNEAGETDWGFYWSSTTHIKNGGLGDSAVYIAFGRALGYMVDAWMDVHGAGAQRSDPKVALSIGNLPDSYVVVDGAITHGPQGDVIRSSNYVRCVRDGE